MLEVGSLKCFRLRRIAVLALLLGLITVATSRAQTQPAPGATATPPPSLGVLADQIKDLFPKVDGEVIEVQGNSVTLALGRKDGIVAGIEMSVYREGRELRHPRTGASLGRTEQTVGRMQIQQVFEAYSIGTAAQGVEVKPGDKARVSSGKINLTLMSV